MSKSQITKIQALWIVALVIIITIGLTYWFQSEINELQIKVNGLQTEVDTLREEVQAFRMLEVAKEIRNTIEQDIQKHVTIGQMAAMLPQVQSGIWCNMKDTLVLYERQLITKSFMWFCYPNGTYYTTLQGYMYNKSLTDRSYFPIVMSGNVSIGTTVYSKTTGEAVHITAIPVFNGSNVVGILGISTPLAEWSKSITTRLNINYPNLFFVLSKNGQYQMHSQTEMILVANPITGEGMNTTIPYISLKNFVKEAFENKEGTGIYEYDGVTKVCSYTTMTNTQWMVFYAEKPN